MSIALWFASKRVLSLCLLLLVCAMLYVGLADDVPESNQVTVSAADGSLIFGERALAYSNQRLSDEWVSYLNETGFEIEIEFSPLAFDKQLFQFILLFTNGDTSEQLSVSQVRDYIIVMNGDDYNYRQKRPRLTAKITDPFQGFQRLKIVANQRSTVLSLNGKKLLVRDKGMLKIPAGKGGLRLLLSGSEVLENNWRGAIKHLSIKPLIKRENRTDYLLYQPQLNTNLNKLVNHWLMIPNQVVLLSHQVFVNESFKINSNSDFRDMVLNLFGFIPFGWLLAMLIIKAPIGFKHSLSHTSFVLFSVFLCGFLLSFVIEYSQVWLVTRQSSLRDLYLNSVGGVLGTMLFLICQYVLKKLQKHKIKV